jgi:uncharacterized protein with PQ loop repeat
MKYFQVFVTFAGIMMSLSYYPQAYKIWKNKAAGQISVFSYLILAIGGSTWLLYGILLKDFTIISGFVFGCIGAWLILILTLIYKSKD